MQYFWRLCRTSQLCRLNRRDRFCGVLRTGDEGIAIYSTRHVRLFTLPKYCCVCPTLWRMECTSSNSHQYYCSSIQNKHSVKMGVHTSRVVSLKGSTISGEVMPGGLSDKAYQCKMDQCRQSKFSVSSRTTRETDTIPDLKKSFELSAFDEVFPSILNTLTDGFNADDELVDAMEWFRQVLLYNVPHGKKNRGLTIVESYRHLKPAASENDLHRARILGWCVELFQAYFLIADDIMDKSMMRRGNPCWYTREGVGMVAINDCFYVRSSIFRLLRLHFRQEPYYTNLLDVFNEIELRTVMGQSLDLLTSPIDGSVDFSKFSMARYETMVTLKTAYYSYYLPVALAMYMAGIQDTESHKEAQAILLKIGYFFQVQDDYLDCYGDPAVTGKIGSDIEDNKPTWLVNRALAMCTDEQISILKQNYGQNVKEKVEKVKRIFFDLGLQEQYANFEEESYQEIMALIDSSSGSLPKEMFVQCAKKIYKRDK